MAERMVGKQAPTFEMQAVLPNKMFGKVSLKENMKAGKWTVLFFYPADFTFVCPTEIVGYNDKIEKFEQLNAVVIGASTDTVHTHKAWINTPVSEGGIGDLAFPLAADHTQVVARKYGILIEEEGLALRGLFIINPEGELQYSVVHHNNIGRNVDETLRVLEALQSGGLCPVNWNPGEALLQPK
ncbi:peroxiredoxin [Massilibacterium senegalense]|uniref:peroxiredoxin n=1 Tax=Massilibacterium senegalense TaxID=1632858 RepID=UPI000783B391|nr:peroxiredoxin [Massilibacterium senegalense]